MNDNQRIEYEFQELVTLCLEGQLSAEKKARFRELMIGNAEFPALYRRQAVVHGMLLWNRGMGARRCLNGIDPIAVAELLAEAEREARRQVEREAAERARLIERAEAEKRRLEEELEQSRRRRPQPIEIPVSVVYLGAAAMAACLFMVFVHFASREELVTAVAADRATAEEVAPEVVVEPVLAVLSDSVEAELYVDDGDSPPTVVPMKPHAGYRAGAYSLDRGVIELEMRSGVKVLIEGPAAYALVSEDRIRVERGRLVGNVSPDSIGFTIETPYAAIVDLGTEFGVEVSMDETVGVTVFDGEVEVVASVSDGAGVLGRRRLEVNESARVNQEGEFLDAVVNDDRFFREVPDPSTLARKQAYERWMEHCKQLAEDDDVLAHYTFDNQEPNDSLLLERANDGQSLHGNIKGATWESGRWSFKQSLRFEGVATANGANNYVHFRIPGKHDALTIAAWVQIDELLGDYVSLFMCADYEGAGDFHWQLRKNGQFHLGFLQDGGLEAQVAWESSKRVEPHQLRTWMHIALVIQESGEVDCYMDGMSVDMVADPDSQQGLTPGLLRLEDVCLGSWLNSTRFPGVTFHDLRGKVDEVLMVGRAMNQQEIVRLVEKGKP